MSRSIDVDTKTFVRFWLVILGFVAVGALIYKAWGGILIILASIFLAIALKPLARHIDNLDKHTERKSLSSVLAVVIVVLSLVAIVGVTGPVIVEQVSKFLSQAPTSISETLSKVDFSGVESFLGTSDLKGQIESGIRDFSTSLLGNISGLAFSSLSAIGNAVTSIIFIVVLTILFMLQGPDLMDKFWQIVSTKKDSETSRTARRIVERLSGVVATYVSRQVFIAVLDGVVTATAVAILSLIFSFDMSLAVPMGLISFIMYLIPMFGPIISAVLNSILLLFNSPWAAAVFLVFYIIYGQIENNVISPKIQSKGLSLSPLIVLVAITIGMYAFGLVGCIIAIPIAGCIKVLIEEYPNIKSLSEKNVN